MIVFLLTGIWHGNGLQFLVWGAVHGILVTAERKIRDHEWYKRIPKALKWALTALFVLLAWVLFMSKDLQSAAQTYSGMFVPMSPGGVGLSWRYYLTNRTLLFLAIAAASEIAAASGLRSRLSRLLDTDAGTIVKRILLIILFMIDILYIVNSTYSPFIYFRF
jgi:alginate O-acetyltransferase complex protein AlgI